MTPTVSLPDSELRPESRTDPNTSSKEHEERGDWRGGETVLPEGFHVHLIKRGVTASGLRKQTINSRRYQIWVTSRDRRKGSF